MPVFTVLPTKIRSTMLCLSGFELYSRWVPLLNINNSATPQNGEPLTTRSLNRKE